MCGPLHVRVSVPLIHVTQPLAIVAAARGSGTYSPTSPTWQKVAAPLMNSKSPAGGPTRDATAAPIGNSVALAATLPTADSYLTTLADLTARHSVAKSAEDAKAARSFIESVGVDGVTSRPLERGAGFITTVAETVNTTWDMVRKVGAAVASFKPNVRDRPCPMVQACVIFAAQQVRARCRSVPSVPAPDSATPPAVAPRLTQEELNALAVLCNALIVIRSNEGCELLVDAIPAVLAAGRECDNRDTIAYLCNAYGRSGTKHAELLATVLEPRAIALLPGAKRMATVANTVFSLARLGSRSPVLFDDVLPPLCVELHEQVTPLVAATLMDAMATAQRPAHAETLELLEKSVNVAQTPISLLSALLTAVATLRAATPSAKNGGPQAASSPLFKAAGPVIIRAASQLDVMSVTKLLEAYRLANIVDENCFAALADRATALRSSFYVDQIGSVLATLSHFHLYDAELYAAFAQVVIQAVRRSDAAAGRFRPDDVSSRRETTNVLSPKALSDVICAFARVHERHEALFFAAAHYCRGALRQVDVTVADGGEGQSPPTESTAPPRYLHPDIAATFAPEDAANMLWAFLSLGINNSNSSPPNSAATSSSTTPGVGQRGAPTNAASAMERLLGRAVADKDVAQQLLPETKYACVREVLGPQLRRLTVDLTVNV